DRTRCLGSTPTPDVNIIDMSVTIVCGVIGAAKPSPEIHDRGVALGFGDERAIAKHGFPVNPSTGVTVGAGLELHSNMIPMPSHRGWPHAGRTATGMSRFRVLIYKTQPCRVIIRSPGEKQLRTLVEGLTSNHRPSGDFADAAIQIEARLKKP